jgi:pimeloyl-ACP methyl ester carboxylesterase
VILAPMEGSERVVEIEGQKSRVLEAGQGSPVLVLHGWGGRIESMAPVVGCLADAFHVVAVDLPGFGQAPVPEEQWGTPEYARFVRSLMGELGVARASFVGHSFGAKVSLHLAATEPEMVDKLVLQGSSGLRTPPSIKARLKRTASRAARRLGGWGPVGRKVQARAYEKLASQDYKDAGPMRPILVRVVNEDLVGLLPHIAAPTLLVWGSKDDAVPVAHARTMEQSIPDAGLVVFEGAGHFAYLDEPRRFCRVVRHFLGSPLP